MRYDLPEDKNELAYVLENQESMLNYHGKSVVSQSHPFSSKWYSWPIVKRPLWAYNDYTLPEGMSSTITIMGNPAIWWLGLACVASFLLYFAWRDWRALFFLISYLAQIIPWIFVERTTFIYHYFSCVPFMIVAICYIFAFLQENNIFLAKYIKYYYILSILFFIVFYPALSGLVVGQNYIASLRWFNDWIF